MVSLRIILFLYLIVNYSLVEAYLNEKFDTIVTNLIDKIFTKDDTLIFIFDKIVELELPKVVKNDYAIARLHLSSQETVSATIQFSYSKAFFNSKYSKIRKYLIIINDKNLTNVNAVFDRLWTQNVRRIVVLTYNTDNEVFEVHTSDPLHEENSCGKKSKIVHSEFYTENASIKYASVYRNINKCMLWNEVDSVEKAYPLYIFFDKVFHVIAKEINGSYHGWTEPNPKINVPNTVTLRITLENENTPIFYYEKFDVLPSGVGNPIYFVIKSGKEIPPIKVLVMIFTVKLWIFIILAYVSTSITVWIIASCDRKQFIVWQLANIFLDVLSATLWGWLSFKPKESKIRCIFICYLFYHIHVYTAFTSNLITILTTPQFDRGISNLQELQVQTF
ncbi:hypothetical protein FQR65_LT07594 [Abscondita terminalis]|nr:hypothetical protein FQR65_LT07594 [Abscondita terminalis]